MIPIALLAAETARYLYHSLESFFQFIDRTQNNPSSQVDVWMWDGLYSAYSVTLPSVGMDGPCFFSPVSHQS